MSMQTFYESLHRSSSASGLLAIAKASLRKVLAVRSEMAWTEWEASVNAS